MSRAGKYFHRGCFAPLVPHEPVTLRFDLTPQPVLLWAGRGAAFRCRKHTYSLTSSMTSGGGALDAGAATST
jgi:hypothetical protein